MYNTLQLVGQTTWDIHDNLQYKLVFSYIRSNILTIIMMLNKVIQLGETKQLQAKPKLISSVVHAGLPLYGSMYMGPPSDSPVNLMHSMNDNYNVV